MHIVSTDMEKLRMAVNEFKLYSVGYFEKEINISMCFRNIDYK